MHHTANDIVRLIEERDSDWSLYAPAVFEDGKGIDLLGHKTRTPDSSVCGSHDCPISTQQCDEMIAGRRCTNLAHADDDGTFEHCSSGDHPVGSFAVLCAPCSSATASTCHECRCLP